MKARDTPPAYEELRGRRNRALKMRARAHAAATLNRQMMK